jgi:hypothetical protein
LREVHVLQRIIIPDFGGQDEGDKSEPLPITVVHEEARFDQESLEVYQTKDRDFFLHSTRDDHVLAIIIYFFYRGITHVLRFSTNKLITRMAVVLIKDSHLELQELLEALLVRDV